jgi:hypothetical protein
MAKTKKTGVRLFDVENQNGDHYAVMATTKEEAIKKIAMIEIDGYSATDTGKDVMEVHSDC